MRECCSVTGLLSHADMIRYLSSRFTFLLSSSRTQMPIEALWPWDNSDRQMKTSLAVKITQTPSVNLHKNDTLWKHKISYRISKCRRGWMDAVSLQRHWTVNCDLWFVRWSGAQLGVIESGWGSTPAGPRPWLSVGGRGLSPAGEGWASALSGGVQATLGLNPAGFPDSYMSKW